MLLRRVVLEDFGLYRGVQEFDLVPRRLNGRLRPVVLFGGGNGAGKSTLFEAILVCLYGKGALGDRVRHSEYLDFLFQRIHRSRSGMSSSRAAVTVEFDFVHAGTRHQYVVTRSWIASNGTASSVDVSLDLLRDGQRLDDLDHSHWDDFLRELIPPGLSQLFFFDGEKIQRLADERDSGELGRSVKSLLNLDLVERLAADLQVYVTREAKELARDADRREIEQLEKLRDHLREQIDQLQSTRAALQSTKLDHMTSKIERLESTLRAEGSELAKARDALIAEKATALSTIQQQEDKLRELAAGTLPFAICPTLLERLTNQLAASEEVVPKTSERRLISSIEDVLKAFVGGELRKSSSLDRKFRKQAAAILRPVLGKAVNQVSLRKADRTPLDDLSIADRRRLLAWAESTFRDAVPEAKRAGERIEKSIRRLHKVESAIAQVPSDDSLNAIVRELNHACSEKGSAQQEINALDDHLRKVSREVADVERRLKLIAERVQREQESRERISVVGRSQAALREYLIAVTELKLKQLEYEVTRCFSQICRKGDLVRSVRIDASTFEIGLLDRNGEAVPKERLSAGEKQIFAVALLWALARTSGRPLPVIIDTPLARLDSDHRRLLIERYLPCASHQILVLSTDTEVDSALFAMLGPHISHAYRLEYDGSERFTTANPGYFWSGNGDTENAARSVLQRG